MTTKTPTQPRPGEQKPLGIHIHHDAPPTNAMGVAGFVVSILGWLTCGLLCPVGLILSLCGISKQPRGLAVAGVTISAAGLIPLMVMVVALCQPAMQAVGRASAQMAAKAIIHDDFSSRGTLPSGRDGNAMLAGLDREMRYVRVSDTSYTVQLAGTDGVFDTADDRVVTFDVPKP